MSDVSDQAKLDPTTLATPPTRSDIFSIVGPLFRAVNNQDAAIVALKAGDDARFEASMTTVSSQLDEALSALTKFMGAAQ